LIGVRIATKLADWRMTSPAIGGEKFPAKLRERQQ